jgi:hypothetical protein
MSSQTAVVHFKTNLAAYDHEASNNFLSVGLDASGSYFAVTNANFIQSASTITDAIELLDASISTISGPVYTKTEVDQLFADLVNSAPSTLDTLGEIAASIGNDTLFTANFVVAITGQHLSSLNAESTIRGDLATEIARATAAESTLAGNIASEESRAITAENLISTTMAQHISSSLAVDVIIANAYNTMVSDRESALNTLENHISTMIIGRDTTANQNLQTEIARATGAESTITANLDAEIARATGAESTIRVNLDTEIARAISAESTIQGDLTAEVNRATTAENGLSGRLTTVEENDVNKDGSDIMTGNINMSGYRILGVADPTDAQDLVNKRYVDQGIGGLGNAFEYVDTITVVSGTPYDMSSLTGVQTGDVYKIGGVAGQISTPTGNLNVKVDDFVIFNGTTWDIFTNNDILVQSTTDRVAVGGNGFAGYTIDIDANYAGQSTITTVGTITTGTYEGSVIATAFGGLGQSSFSQGALLLGNDSNGLNVVSLGANGTMLKSSGATAAWVPQDTANFTLTTTLVNDSGIPSELGLTTSSTVQEAIDGLYTAMKKRKYVQYIGPVNSATYETAQESLLNGKVHFLNRTGNGFVMLPSSAAENAVVRIVHNGDPFIAQTGEAADDSDMLVKFVDNGSEVEIAYIAPKDTMVFIYSSTQSPKWMSAIGI